MSNYYLRRVISAIFTIFLIATITFFLMRAIPGGPFTREKEIPPAVMEAIEEKYNLNDPLIVQYFDYIVGIVTFDMGPSFRYTGRSVESVIMSGAPTSAVLGGVASILIIVVGIPIGIISALKQNKSIDYFVMFLATLGVTIPSFVLATGLQYFMAYKLGWVPTSGFDLSNPSTWDGIFLPVIALSGYSLSFVARLTRSSMLEVLRQDYIRTARANGLSEFKVIAKHALKNALIPVVTYVGPMVASIMTGSFVIEKIFVINGIGRYFVESVSNRDYTLVMGVTIFFASFYIIMVLLVDVAYSFIDPRIKFDK